MADEDIKSGFQVVLDDDYRIAKDAHQYLLQEKRTGLEGKSKGKEIWTVASYHGSVASALKKYKEIQIGNSNITTIDELLHRINQIDKHIDKVLGDN